MKRSLIAAICLSATAVAGAGAARPYVFPSPQRAEAIYGATFDERGLTLRVNSNGCTRKEHFNLRVGREGRLQTVLAVRIKPDMCKALMRGGISLTWSLRELGIERGADVKVLNRFAVW